MSIMGRDDIYASNDGGLVARYHAMSTSSSPWCKCFCSSGCFDTFSTVQFWGFTMQDAGMKKSSVSLSISRETVNSRVSALHRTASWQKPDGASPCCCCCCCCVEVIHCERFERISSSLFDLGLFFVNDDDATVSFMLLMMGWYHCLSQSKRNEGSSEKRKLPAMYKRMMDGGLTFHVTVLCYSYHVVVPVKYESFDWTDFRLSCVRLEWSDTPLSTTY